VAALLLWKYGAVLLIPRSPGTSNFSQFTSVTRPRVFASIQEAGNGHENLNDPAATRVVKVQ
jgi:hypothetical protein